MKAEPVAGGSPRRERNKFDRALHRNPVSHGLNELIYLVGLYALVSVTLNGFDVPLPE